MWMATFYQATKHVNKVTTQMLKRPEVVGIGVGFANPTKKSLGAGIIVYTKKNVTVAANTSLRTALKKTMNKRGLIPIRVIPIGALSIPRPIKMKSRPFLASFRSRHRPVPGGVSIGRINPNFTTSTGTAGINVINPTTKQKYILSNNHVLVRDNQFAADILQPGPLDGGTSNDKVGTSTRFVPFRTTGNIMDAAIATPTINSLLNPRYLANANGELIVVPGHLLSYQVGERFKKSGRTTGSVRGEVEAINVSANVTYPGVGTFPFTGLTIVKSTTGGAVAGGGDSGSVWLRDSDNFAAAVHFASGNDKTRSTSFPIDRAMRAFGVRIVIPAASARGKAKMGAIKGAPPKRNYAYVQPVTKKHLLSTQVLKAVKAKRSSK